MPRSTGKKRRAFKCHRVTKPGIRAVLFDFDGTLTKPGALDFSEIRRALRCPERRPILEYIDSLSLPSRRNAALRILHKFELEAARRSEPNLGAESLVRFIQSRSLLLGILTRNTRRAIMESLRNFKQLKRSDFQVLLTRDDGFMPKPDPSGIREAARRLDLAPEQILVVGDFVYDIEAGHEAGSPTVFLTNGADSPATPLRADYTIHRLEELKGIVRLLTPLPMGKLPNDLLRTFLAELEIEDRSLLIGPKVGEDFAAVRIGGERVLILKSDPVTFALDEIGYYAVTVNANDIATSGAVPRWLLCTLLFPPGTTPDGVRQAFVSLQEAARNAALVLCGGHTEITDAVNRPVAAAYLAGTIPRSRLVDKRSVREGDAILLTKHVAIEGTAILARNFPRVLRSRGMAAREIEACRAMLVNPGISILPEARIAANTATVSAMHDVTEGGLAGALEEFSSACGRRLRIRPHHIPVHPATRRCARLLKLHPLGLIGSGSLLIVCRPDTAGPLRRSIEAQGIAATVIGEVLEEGHSVEAVGERGRKARWPSFEVDELARVFPELEEQEWRCGQGRFAD